MTEWSLFYSCSHSYLVKVLWFGYRYNAQILVFGSKSHILPNALRQCHQILHAFLHLDSMCSCHLIFGYKTTLKYLNCCESCIVWPSIFEIMNSPMFLLFIKRFSSIFCEFIESHYSPHHVTTLLSSLCMRLKKCIWTCRQVLWKIILKNTENNFRIYWELLKHHLLLTVEIERLPEGIPSSL